MNVLERATRTVFINNLHIRVTEKDLFILFTQRAGKVTDILMIVDKATSRSKGVAYVELDSLDSMARALSLTGTELYGQAIQIRPSEMEKNIEWTLQKKLEKATNPDPITARPNADIASIAAAAAAALSNAPPLDGSAIAAGGGATSLPADLRKVYIGNIPSQLNDAVLRSMFEPFGIVESCLIKTDASGKPLSYGFVVFKQRDAVDKAIAALNGVMVGGNTLKVNYASPGMAAMSAGVPLPPIQGGGHAPPHAPPSSLPPPPPSSFPLPPPPPPDYMMNEDAMRASNRMALMQRLAQASNVALPQYQYPQAPLPPQQQAAASHQTAAMLAMHPLNHIQGLLGPPSPVPTPCLLLKNMFDPREQDASSNQWLAEIQEDVQSECSRFGQVLHLFIDPTSQGFVYVRMSSVEGAVKARELLHGRIYGGRPILVEFQFVQMYNPYFRLQ